MGLKQAGQRSGGAENKPDRVEIMRKKKEK